MANATATYSPAAINPAPATVGKPFLWLAAIVAVGLGLRISPFLNPLQLDEFPPLYSVAERKAPSPDFTPPLSEPLVAVPGLAEVRERTILPYGIENPLPLYHYLLYGIVKVIPLAEWSHSHPALIASALRLPSLLAGLGCIVGIYFLCRRRLGDEVALVAALLTAIDPLQITVSRLDAPIRHRQSLLLGDIRRSAVAYQYSQQSGLGVCCRGVWYFHGASRQHESRLADGSCSACGSGGVQLVQSCAGHEPGERPGWVACRWALALLLLSPLFGFYAEVGRFAKAHQEYLFVIGGVRIQNVLVHNSTFLIALLVASVAGYVVRQVQQQDKPAAEGEAAVAITKEPAALSTKDQPLPEDPMLVWLGRGWLFLPQMVLLVIAFGFEQSVYLSRYFSYTSLAGAIVLAFWATREQSRDMRLGVSAAVVLAVLLWGRASTDYSKGAGLVSPMLAPDNTTPLALLTMQQIDELAKKQPPSWLPDDVLLVRSGFLEADLQPFSSDMPERTRHHLEAILKCPYTTLYVGTSPREIVVLSKSLWRNDKLYAGAGSKYDYKRFYNGEVLGKRLKELADPKGKGTVPQFWLASNNDPDRNQFFTCFLPWLADTLGWDLTVSSTRPKSQHYFDVLTGSEPTDYLERLSNPQKDDFTYLVRIQRARPSWYFAASAVSELPPDGNIGSLTALVWQVAQPCTPRKRVDPEAEVETDYPGKK